METTSGLTYEVSNAFGPYEIRLPDGVRFLTAQDLREMQAALAEAKAKSKKKVSK